MSAAGIFARRATSSCLRSTCASTLIRDSAMRIKSGSILKNQPQLAILLQRYYASKSFPPHTVITMPALSPTMTAGNIGTWHKNPGDSVTAGDVLVEIETDKAQMDFEYQEDDGVLAKVLTQTGEKDIAVGNPIAVLVRKNVDISAFSDFTVDDAGGAKKPALPPKEEALDSPEQSKKDELAPSPTPGPQAKESESSGKPIETVLDRDGIYASPVAKKIAIEKGVPLKNIKGTGENGRITKADVENYLKTSSGSLVAAALGAPHTDIPLTAMRKTIASRLTTSKNTAPHYYIQSAVNATKLLKLRAALNASGEGKYKLSVNDFFIKAVAAALQKVPAVNSSYLEAEGVVRQYNVVDISVAVATPIGLMTPIIKSAHARGLQSISAEVKALAARAQESKLKPEEYQGGTFTISNMGMNPAVERFTAIINPPQAAILAVGAVKKVPVETEDGGVAWEEQIVLTTSFDHRAIDGAVGADFMRELKKIIENPLELLL